MTHWSGELVPPTIHQQLPSYLEFILSWDNGLCYLLYFIDTGQTLPQRNINAFYIYFLYMFVTLRIFQVALLYLFFSISSFILLYFFWPGDKKAHGALTTVKLDKEYSLLNICICFFKSLVMTVFTINSIFRKW